MKKFAVISLGCPKNLTDSEAMSTYLLEAGYQLVAEDEAEIILLNTCAFIKPAVAESETEITNLLVRKRTGQIKKLVVVGCYVERFRSDILRKFPEIDAVLGIGKQDSIVEVIEQSLKKIYNLPEQCNNSQAGLKLTLPHTAYLKIADGCDNSCAYCLIPQLRGRYRSRPIDDIIAEAQLLVDRGVKELTLIAQDSTNYGRDLYRRRSLANLLERLVSIKGDFWLRIMYSYPDHLDREVLELMATEDKLCSYLDLPLQHISDHVLQEMQRQSTNETIRKKLDQIKSLVPDVALRTTFIVGYPGETEEDFAELLKFLKEVEFNKVAIFEYWQEEGTVAARLPDQVDDQVKKIRAQKLIDLQSTIIDRMNEKMIGKKRKILLDAKDNGRSQQEAPEIDGSILLENYQKSAYQIGDFAEAEITSALGYQLRGVLVT